MNRAFRGRQRPIKHGFAQSLGIALFRRELLGLRRSSAFETRHQNVAGRDRSPKSHFGRQFPHTETRADSYCSKHTKFHRPSYVKRWRPDWLAGVVRPELRDLSGPKSPPNYAGRSSHKETHSPILCDLELHFLCRVMPRGFSSYYGMLVVGHWRKKRIISRLASGPRGSVYDPAVLPPDRDARFRVEPTSPESIAHSRPFAQCRYNEFRPTIRRSLRPLAALSRPSIGQ